MIFLFLAGTLFLSCSMDGGTGSSVRSQVSGELYIEIPETIRDDFILENLDGSILITIGKNIHTVYPSIITHNTYENRLVVPLETVTDFEGVAVITCVSRLTYLSPPDETPIPYAGYMMTRLDKDKVNRINDTDNDGVVSAIEAETMPLLSALRFYTDMDQEKPVQPNSKPDISAFSTSSLTTNKLSVTIDGSVSSLDWGLVYIRVNNQYQWIEPHSNPHYPGQISFPAFVDKPGSVSLKPGQNEIQLIAVNSVGVSVSTTSYVNSTAKLDSAMENVLITLTWDSLADLDLHTWYYPPGSTEAAWHNYWFAKEVPLSDNMTNLDIDNQTGFGPEHFTLLGAPDGYYIIAVNAYKGPSDPLVPGSIPANAFVSIETNRKMHSLGPFRIRDASTETYPVNNNPSWAHAADIRISNGIAEVLSSPDMSINPPKMTESPDSSLGRIDKSRRLLRER